MLKLIENALKLNPPQTIEFPFFGKLICFKFKDTAKKYYEGSINFGSIFGNVKIFINAGDDGLSYVHCIFLRMRKQGAYR